jgi:hypothetical protein
VARTRTILVDVGKLHRLGAEGALVVRLMMALNDLTMGNNAQGKLCPTDGSEPTYMERVAAMYLVRIQMAHLNEAFKIVEEIKANSGLLAFIAGCPSVVAEKFNQLLCFAKGGSKRHEFCKYIETVRNKAAFHYDRGEVECALDEYATRKGHVGQLATFSSKISSARFQVADGLMEELIYHRLWNARPGPQSRSEVDEILKVTFGIFQTFVRFGGELLLEYLQKNARFDH